MGKSTFNLVVSPPPSKSPSNWSEVFHTYVYACLSTRCLFFTCRLYFQFRSSAARFASQSILLEFCYRESIRHRVDNPAPLTPPLSVLCCLFLSSFLQDLVSNGETTTMCACRHRLTKRTLSVLAGNALPSKKHMPTPQPYSRARTIIFTIG